MLIVDILELTNIAKIFDGPPIALHLPGGRETPALMPALGRSLDRYLEPFAAPKTEQAARERARESCIGTAARYTGGALKFIALPLEALDTAIAFFTVPLGAMYEAAAASLGTLHIGTVHGHCHAPALPTPLPSFGAVLMGTCFSVLISGKPAARAGDFGLAISCGTFTPPFQIVTGSSKVFIGGARAARCLDITRHCQPATQSKPDASTAARVVDAFAPLGGPALATGSALAKARSEGKVAIRGPETIPGTAAARSEAAEAQGHALAAAVQGIQAASSASAMVASMLMGKDPGTSPCHGALLLGDPRVLIGGFLLPPTTTMLAGLGKKLSAGVRDSGMIDHLRRLRSRVFAPGRAANAHPRARSVVTGHPVDVVTGRLVFDACDLELPGAPPLRFERAYSSAWSARDSPLGRGWSHSLDECVWSEADHLVYLAEDGRELELPRTDDEHYLASERLTLRRLPGDRWQIEDHHGVRRDFAAIAGDRRRGRARLIQRRDRAGHTLRCAYDERARLIAVHADGDREIRLYYAEDGHLAQIDLPDPDAPGLVPHVRYVHDGADLTEIHDALGHVTRYRHDRHRIIEEQLPGGLRFQFAYAGDEPDAPCVRTWGDGGIVDHRLVHDRARRTTVVTNACNETTIYRADERGLVVEICDPRGAVTRFTHDEHLRRTEIIDPLGHVTRDSYDARGNCVRHEAPDGAVTTTIYDGRLDLPVARTDPAGGHWRWSHDALGRITRATDPLGRSTTHHHDLSPETGHTTVTTVHPDGRSERRTHDPAGRLVRVDLSDGTSFIAHTHDRRGRLRRSVDDRGRVETRDHDLLGRLTRHVLPDGEVRHFIHDARGLLVRACDAQSDLRCSYTGLGWLASCGDGTAPPIILERDLEGRLTRVAGPTGTLLRLERDPAGRVRVAVDALGIQRRYTRDLLGRITEIQRPNGARTRYTRDPAGRIIAVEHGQRGAHEQSPSAAPHPIEHRAHEHDLRGADGPVRDLFTYRADGELLTATRHHPDGTVTIVRRDLDAMARVLREHQDEHTIDTEYDLRDRPVRLRSSSGADLRFVHDDRGLARVELCRQPWALEIERDRDGREQARHLPGEVLSWWQADRLGRPAEHGVIATRPPQIHRQRRYHWTAASRLEAITDAVPRRRSPAIPPPPPPQIQHDAEGRRISSELSDGTRWTYRWNHASELAAAISTNTAITYRHDALGRRIERARDGAGTRWIWHGDVLLHELGPDTVTWVFEPGGFAPLARLTAETRHAVVGDHLGVPLALFDERGQLAWAADLDARARVLPTRGEPSLCPFRLPGHIADPDTGLAHSRFRDYDPATATYLSPDPLGLFGGLDLHAYVADPRTQTDVFGLRVDRPASLAPHTRLAPELAHDLFLNGGEDLPPAIAHVLRREVAVDDHQSQLITALRTPPRGACG